MAALRMVVSSEHADRVIVSPKRLTKSGQEGRGILRNSGRFIDRAVRADVDEERRPSNIQIAGESGVSGQVLSALHPLCRSSMSHRLHFDAANAALSVEPGLARLRHHQNRARPRLASRQAGDHYDPNLQLLRDHERAQSLPRLMAEKIGRASCMERVWPYG